MSREDQYLVTLNVEGEDTGVWDKMSGGAVESEEVKYRPGGMGKQRSLGGPKSVTNITLTRLEDPVRDANELPWLMQVAGDADCVVTKQKLDKSGIAIGRPMVYTGKLLNVTPPDHDSESSDPAMIELEISTDGEVA